LADGVDDPAPHRSAVMVLLGESSSARAALSSSAFSP
jgi:hypothetical protein